MLSRRVVAYREREQNNNDLVGDLILDERSPYTADVVA